MDSREVREALAVLLREFPSLRDAHELAATLHEGQVRPTATTPEAYILHPTRVALRLASWGVTSGPLLRAAFLHDVVEDCSRRYARSQGLDLTERVAREYLLEELAVRFGPEEAHLVAQVTNPLRRGRRPSLEEFHRSYQEAVREKASADPRVLLLKLADWLDNASGVSDLLPLHPERARSLAAKYLPLAPFFHEEIFSSDSLLPQPARFAVEELISAVERELRVVLLSAPAPQPEA